MESSQEEMEGAVRVTVAPTQSSYFAGEPFAVTITFTNTHSPESKPQPGRSMAHTHKRGAHSISSAPISKPPTSPRTPRTPAIPTAPPRLRSPGHVPARKGLVGHQPAPKGADVLPELIEQRRRKLLAKNLSVSITPHHGEDELVELPKTASYTQTHHILSPYSPTHPLVPSPLSRSDALPLSADHPHARKDSLLDGSLSLQEISSPVSTASVFSPSPSSSTFSLALESISESSANKSYSSTPALPSPHAELPHSLPPNAVYAYPVPTRRRSTQIGLGQPPNDPKHLGPPRTAFSSTFPQPNTELILYSYAKFSGGLVISSPSTSPEHTQNLGHIRSSLRRTSIGGGSMDITSSLTVRPPVRRHHSRTSSISSGLLSLLSPSPTQASFPPSASSSSFGGRTPGSSMSFPSPASFVSRMGLAANEDSESESPLPTFQTQPVMLGVDLALSPGESRTYKYSVPLPANLPPTFRGRSFKFSYELVVGTCRSGSSTSSSTSRVMKVPIRVYNNVDVGRPPRPYDLLWPARTRNEPTVNGSAVEDVRVPNKAAPRTTGSFKDVREYAAQLVASLSDPTANGVKITVPAEMADADREWRMRHPSHNAEDDGSGSGLNGCREAVEILTRNPKKSSYDVHKDGVKVAVLTFTKSAYRLGETVLGVVEINERTSRSRVLQMSAKLETQEHLPSSISTQSNSQQLRKVHAEHHSSFTLSILRTNFTLDIPSDATPAFQIVAGDDDACKPGGLEWKVRLCLLVAVAAEDSQTGTEGVRMKSLVRDDASGAWGASWRATQGIAPLEKPPAPPKPAQGQGWTSYLLGWGEIADDDKEKLVVDGIKVDPAGGVGVGVDYDGGQDGWKAVRVETVECEVPIKVWPGNTAFKAADVVFGV